MIHDNLIDQAPTLGGIFLAPVGLGILGLQIRGNYISTAQDTLNGIGVLHASTAAGLNSVTIANNEFAFCGEGVRLQNAGVSNVVVDGNVFYSMAQNVAVRAFGSATASQVNMGSNAYGGATPLVVS